MTTILLVLGAIAPLFFVALFALGAVVGVVGEVARLYRRLVTTTAPPREGRTDHSIDRSTPVSGGLLWKLALGAVVIALALSASEVVSVAESTLAPVVSRPALFGTT